MSFFQKYKEVLIAAGVVAGGGLLYFAAKKLTGGKSLMAQLKDTLGIAEVGGDNISFSDAEFQKELINLGWQSGWSWCVMYSKYIWSKILPKNKWDVAKNLISVNSQTTWAAFGKDTSGYFERSNIPKVGSIAIWQSSPTSGHAGIVTKVAKDYFMTQEGNYSGKVSVVKRYYNFNSYNSEGLKLLGFIRLK